MSPHPPINLANINAQMRKGLLEFALLLILSRGQAYTNELLEELRQAGLLVVEGTVYPLLMRLKTSGLLTYDWIESKNGPPRKYYALTPAGRTTLAELAQTWGRLNASMATLTKKFIPTV